MPAARFFWSIQGAAPFVRTGGDVVKKVSGGMNVRRIRRAREWSQTQVARSARITQQQLSDFENGLRMPLPILKRLARVLGVPVDELLGEPHQTAEPVGRASGSEVEATA